MTRATIRKTLQDKGFTYREARKVVSQIFKFLVQELKTKGEVTLPFGTLTMKAPSNRRAYKLGKLAKYSKPSVRFKEK